MKAISLFSGVGGFEIGFERAGIETVLQAERDPWALEVLARHWPGTERVTDVRDVGDRRLSGEAIGRPGGGTRRGRGDDVHAAGERTRTRDSVDLVYGGFPCQDLSVAGKRAGLGGERSGLWFEFERVLRELRPRWAVIENVPGLLSSNSGRDFAVILAGLDELGFDVAWAILDARHFGVPQRRRRVFIVAGPRGRGPEQVLSLCESCGGNPETGRAAGEGTTGALSAGTLRAGGVSAGNNPGGGHLDNLIAHALRAQGNDPHREDQSTYIVASAVSASAGHHGHSSPRGDGSDNLVAYSLNARDARGPLPDRSIGNVAIQNGVRRLTPLECERLMGWPDDHTRWTADGREISDSHRYRMAGNGVVASVAEWIGHRLVAVDGMLS